MKLEIENCKCGGHCCTGKLLYLDGSLMDGIHDAETATTLQTAVNLHDEMVEALRAAFPPLKAFRAMADEGSKVDEACKKLEAVLAKVERKG